MSPRFSVRPVWASLDVSTVDESIDGVIWVRVNPTRAQLRRLHEVQARRIQVGQRVREAEGEALAALADEAVAASVAYLTEWATLLSPDGQRPCTVEEAEALRDALPEGAWDALLLAARDLMEQAAEERVKKALASRSSTREEPDDNPRR